ncbi:MAG: hypothetical protein ACYDBB_24565 [Armatimonadota bacterium]
MHTGTHRYTCWGFVLLLALWAGSAHAAAFFFSESIVARAAAKKPYPVYVISNLPQQTVMPPICRNALQLKDGNTAHCTYLSLANLAPKILQDAVVLPFAPAEHAEMILVIDRSTLTKTEQTVVDRVLTGHYPQLPAPPPGAHVRLWVQNSGKSGGEYQVLIDLPHQRWLAKAADNLWAFAAGSLQDGSRETISRVYPVGRLAVLTNDTGVQSVLNSALRYSETELYGLDRVEQFRDVLSTDRKVIALNWNSEQECTPAMAAQILPSPLRAVTGENTPDRAGVSGWQHFCRQAVAQHYTTSEGDVWVIAAPTAAYLRKLTDQVIAANFSGGPYRLPVCDFTQLRRIAVGAYLRVDGPDEDRFLGWRELDVAAAGMLGARATVVSVDEWSRALRDVSSEDAARIAPDAVLLLTIDTLTPKVEFTTSSRRVTPVYPAFTMLEPPRPSPPDPNERYSVSHREYIYPGKTTEGRTNSAEFKQIHDQWEKEMAKWKEDHAEWEKKKEELEKKGGSHISRLSHRLHEPKQPKPPNPDEQKDITYVAYRYPGGSNHERELSGPYREEYRRWERESYSHYLEDYHDWEGKRQRWTDDRKNYEVKYDYTVSVATRMAMKGSLQLFDLYGDQLPQWSCPVEMSNVDTPRTLRTCTAVAYGDEDTPGCPRELEKYQTLSAWRDILDSEHEEDAYRLGQTVMQNALKLGLYRIFESALWPGDLQPWNRAQAK